MKLNAFSALFGGIFGFLLCWLTFTQVDTIFGALAFSDLYLWKVFITAVVTAFLGLRLLRRSKAQTWTQGERVKWTPERPNKFHIIGAVIFGIGWGVCGTCPGPALAQLASGRLAGGFTCIGIFAGIFLCDRVCP
jgi:uncharacterized membrane protein YedE/YeeE